MKNRLLPYLATLFVFFGAFYTLSHLGVTYESHHPSLNDKATAPELYLSNARHYAKEHMIVRSLFHLDQAITSIRNLEMDFDQESVEKVEDAIFKLEAIYDEIMMDSLISDDMYSAFEYTLNTLALAEMKVSERYAKSDSTDLAKLALKYAYLHLKTASNYSLDFNIDKERLIYHEIDSIIQLDDPRPEEMLSQIDHILAEMDPLVKN